MRQRLRRLPAVALLVVAFVMFVGGGVLAGLPYEVPSPSDPAATVDCGPPLFEWAAPTPEGDDSVSDGCGAQAPGRMAGGIALMAAGVAVGYGARRVHRRQVMEDHRAARPDSRRDATGTLA